MVTSGTVSLSLISLVVSVDVKLLLCYCFLEKYTVVNFQHVLQREEHWNNWKNEGCPSFERVKAKDAPKPKAR